MKKYGVIILLILGILSLIGCNKKEKWKYSIVCGQESSDISYVISYSSEKVISNTGFLTIENKNDFDVKVHLITDGQEHVRKIEDGGTEVFYPLIKNTEYRVGCHADVPAGREIKLIVYDGEK